MLSSLSRRISNLEQAVSKKENQHIWFYDDRTEVYATDEFGKQKNKVYIPSTTGKLFEAQDNFVQFVMGPYGSGKTTMALHKIVRKVCEMPYWSNGRRKARVVIIRNTTPELYSTTLQSWISWFGELGDIKPRQKPILTHYHMFNDGFGIVELEVLFLALDREADLRKLKSLEVTYAYCNEVSELPQGVVSHLKGRMNGRYPNRSFCPEPYWSGILCDTNPPDEDHWIYKTLEEQDVEGYTLLKQPPGLVKDEDGNWIDNPNADNRVNLAPDYYSKMATGQSEEFIKVYCLGQYGIVGLGKKVYAEYNDDLHSRDTLEPIQGDPIDLCWDGGHTPACIVTQMTPRGQMRALKEYTVENMGIRTFAESIVLPSLKRDFPYNPKIGSSVADPSGVRKDEIMREFSMIGELNELGITTIPASTNSIGPRISSVRYFLNKMIDGQPAFLLSRKGCPVLRKGFAKDYVFKRVAIQGEERYRDEPDKNMASHPHDALQYRCLEHAAENIATNKRKDQPNMFNPGLRI